MKRFALFCVIISVVALGCNTNNHEKEIAQVDSLLNAMQTANQGFLAMDSNKISACHDSSASLLNFIDHNYKDTMELETAVLVSDYAYIKKVLGKYDDQKTEYQKQMAYNQKQLTNLRQDLEHGALPEDSLGFFIETETNAVERLNKSIASTVENVERQIIKYDSLHPKVKMIVENLKTTIETK